MSTEDDVVLRDAFNPNTSNEMCITCEMNTIYNSFNLWTIFWILWIIVMVIIVIDIIRILRDCIVTFYICHYYANINYQIQQWPYLESNTYRLHQQQDEQQTKCPICYQLFDRCLPQSILFCGDRFCRDCININEHNRWISFDDGILAYEWSECPICNIPYHIIQMKFRYNYNPYLGFWSFYSNTFRTSLIHRISMFLTSLLIFNILYYSL